MKKLENILKLVPLFTFLLIVASSIKLAIYYSVFNINIVDYLNVSEYIPLFIDDMHSLLYAGSMMLLGAILVKGVGLKSHKTKYYEENKSLRVSYIIFITVLAISTPLILYFMHDNWYERLYPLNGIFISIMIVILVVFATYKRIAPIYRISWLIGILSIPIVISAYTDAYRVLDKKETLNYEVSIKNRMFSSENNYQFIGKSSKYIFLYNNLENASVIYPIEEVRKIKIKKVDDK